MKTLNMIALALVVIGGLNWGLVGLFEFDAVAAIFGGQDEVASRVIYVLVGLAALYGLYLFRPVLLGTETDTRHRPRTA